MRCVLQDRRTKKYWTGGEKFSEDINDALVETGASDIARRMVVFRFDNVDIVEVKVKQPIQYEVVGVL